MSFATSAVGEVLIPVLRLFGFTIAGFLVFKIVPIQKALLKPFVWFTINLIFPLYFIHTLPAQWRSAGQSGWGWAVIFFAAYLIYVGIQILAARLLINRTRLLKTEYPRELLVIFAMHNAGYIPLPIVAALAPAAVSLYLSFYIMAFVILFFTLAVWLIQGSSGVRTKFTVNAPMVGIAAGLVIAATGIYPHFPAWVRAPFRFASSIALDGVMVVLGAVLASIPRRALRFRREFAGYVLFKMMIFPTIVLVALIFVPLRGMPAEVAAGIKLALVLEAAVPPATNIMVVTKAYGSDEQVEYAGSAIITSYLAGLILLPAFLVLSRMFFG